MSTELNAVRTLLDRGIEVRVTAPLCLRAFGKKTVGFVLRQPYLGTLYRVSELYLSMEISEEALQSLDAENIHFLLTRHGGKLANIVAQAMINSYMGGKLFGGMLAAWLRWRLTPAQLVSAAYTIIALSGTEAFTNTIRLVRTMKVTAPNLSHTAEGS